MIYVTRLNHTEVVLNSDLIEHVDTTPDTVVSLTTGQKLMVLESPEEIIERVIRFKRAVLDPERSTSVRLTTGQV
jgi:flagellar protein FlbD